MTKQSPPEFHAQALRLVKQSLPDHEAESGTIRTVAKKVGVSMPRHLPHARRHPQARPPRRHMTSRIATTTTAPGFSGTYSPCMGP